MECDLSKCKHVSDLEDDGSIVHVNLFYGMRVMSRKTDIANTTGEAALPARKDA